MYEVFGFAITFWRSSSGASSSILSNLFLKPRLKPLNPF